MRLIPFLSLLVPVFFAACGPVDVTKETHATRSYEGAMKTFSSEAEALSFVRARVANFDNSITFRMSSGGAAASKRISEVMARESVLAGMKSFAMGGIVILEPEYAEDVLLLHAHRDASIEASLTPSQKAALAKARAIVSKVCSEHRSDYDRALALHDYLVKNATYASSSVAKNLTASTTCMLQSGEGVCEGYVRAYGLLLSMAGIESRYVGGVAMGDSHAWNLVRLEGQWVHVDPTYDDPLPDAPDRAAHSYFGMSDEQIARNHTWSRGSVPAATTTALYYPFRSGFHFATMRELIAYCASHDIPSGYITAYVDELATPGVHVSSLLADAERQVGRRIVAKYTVAASIPCAFNFISKY